MCDLQREVDIPGGAPHLEAETMVKHHIPRGRTDHCKRDAEIGCQAIDLAQRLGQ